MSHLLNLPSSEHSNYQILLTIIANMKELFTKLMLHGSLIHWGFIFCKPSPTSSTQGCQQRGTELCFETVELRHLAGDRNAAKLAQAVAYSLLEDRDRVREMLHLMTLSFYRLHSVSVRRRNYKYGALVEWYDKGSPKFSKERVSKCHSVHHKSHMGWPGIEPVSPLWKAGTNRLRQGPAIIYSVLFSGQPETASIQTDASLAIPQSIQTNSVIVLFIMPQWYPCTHAVFIIPL